MKDEYFPRPGEFDPLASCEGRLAESVGAEATGRENLRGGLKKPLIEFYTPTQLKNYSAPTDQCMVGDFHLQRGAPSVLAGPPGCGKSRATLWLSILGAKGAGEWFGMPVRCRFRTLIIQSENGLTRLHRDFQQIPSIEGLDDWVRISAFPSYRGFAFSNPAFRAELKAAVRDFKPDLVIIDPWNACVRDSMEKDFLEGFEWLREIMAEVPDAACLILHHLRKPRSEDRHKGRNLANLLSGSYVLVSMARSVMVMQPASDDTQNSQVVFTPTKNNDGELGARSAWLRKAGWFEPVPDFDFEAFDNGEGADREPKVNEGQLREIFQDGNRWVKLKIAAEELQELAGVGRSLAYDALKIIGGRFSNILVKNEDGLVSVRSATSGLEA
jgi:AAA domain